MLNKKLLLILWGYVAWNIVSSIYNDKKWKDLRKEIKVAKTSWTGSNRIVVDNFIETHKNILESLKKDILTDENIALFHEKKDEAIKVVEEYKKSSEDFIKNIKDKWTDFIDSKKEEISDIYDEKKSNFDKAKIKAPKKIKKIKDNLIAKI